MNHQEIIRQLHAPFALEEHEFRIGQFSRDKKKVRWFTYIKREVIQHRLDALFGLDWATKHDYEFRTERGVAVVGVSLGILIDGVWRWRSYNGSGSDKTYNENTEKSAATDAFRRAASLWGVGLYLQNAPTVWTENPDGDWKRQGELERDVLNKWVAPWLSRLAGGADTFSTSQPQKRQPKRNIGKPNDNSASIPVKKILHMVKPLYESDTDATTVINYLVSQNQITPATTPLQAAHIMLEALAKNRFKFDDREITEALGGVTIAEYANNATELKQAYELLLIEHDPHSEPVESKNDNSPFDLPDTA